MRLLVFDTETSDKYPETAFLVTAYLGLMDGNGVILKAWEWVVDQGQEIPDDAAAVHGYTTKRVRAEGRKDVKNCLGEIRSTIEAHCHTSSFVPLTSHNSKYDLTLINHEFVRYGIKPLDFSAMPVIDTLTLDKATDKWRKGSRKLEDVARHYGVRLGNEGSAHSADYDAILAGQIALKLRAKLRSMAQGDFWTWLMKYQADAYAEQATSFASYKRGEQKRKPDEIEPDFVADTAWPCGSISIN